MKILKIYRWTHQASPQFKEPSHQQRNYASYPEESSRNPTKKPDVTYENPQTKKNDIRDAVLHNKKKIHNNSSG